MAGSEEMGRENQLREVDRVLLYVAEAQLKAEEIAQELANAGADERFVAALQTTAAAMRAEHKRLMNATFYSVPDEQESIALGEDEPEQERMAV